MKPKGPVVTLLVGLATALVLLGLSMNARSVDTARQRAANPPPPSASPSPSLSPAPVARVNASYAGRVAGGAATVALTTRDGKAIAYLCDGKRVEAWLQGTAVDGTLALTGRGATLAGTYTAGQAVGTVTAGGTRWSFSAPVATAPSGLYRATAMVRGANLVGGWIVLVDGTQVGIVSTDDVPAAAPRLDPATGTATVDGAQLTAKPVDPSAGL